MIVSAHKKRMLAADLAVPLSLHTTMVGFEQNQKVCRTDLVASVRIN